MKIAAIIIGLLLSFSMLTGCGGGNKVQSSADGDLRTKPTTDFTVFKRNF